MRTDAEKRKRQDLIREAIQSKPIGTQQELVQEIKNLGLDVTQTTISRDLLELQVGKWNGRYHIPFTSNDSPAWFATIRQHVLEYVKTGDHLIVLKTKSGTCAIIEKILNDLNMPEIAGIVASGNTVMVAFKTIEHQTIFVELLKKALQQTS